MFKNFDDSTIEIINESAEYTKNNFKLYKIGTESLLYAMFNKEESITRFLLEDYRVTVEEILLLMEPLLIIRNENGLYTEKFMEVIKMSEVICKENSGIKVLEEHLLFALLVVKDTIFESLIKKLNLSSSMLLESLKEYFNISTTNELNSHSINMSQLAKEGKLGKLIGRESYLDRMKIILERKNKNNILLVGSAGVGKTALVEGLCHELLKEKSKYEIIMINIASLVANTKYRGDFEARVNKVLNEVISSENKILFIDEIHTIVGAGSSENQMDVANIIKPYLARSNFKCIGATTTAEYQKSINKDKALARRFQTIFIEELNHEETMNVLLGLVDDYIDYHDVYLDKKYLKYIVKLCDKITNRKFPDKAIDLMDEAMTIAKRNGLKNISSNEIDKALKNICGINIGELEHEFIYQEIIPFYVDNYLGVGRKNLVSINYSGSDYSLLLNELKQGFGISDESILTINLANYTDTNNLSSLIGTSPGYIGYDDGGILSTHFSNFVYQIIVLKNFYMASSEIRNFFLNTMGSGLFCDKKGNEYKTNNTVFVFLDYKEQESHLGFIEGISNSNSNIEFDLKINQKHSIESTNEFVNQLKYKGYDLSFDDRDFKENEKEYKTTFLELVRHYQKGRYLLRYDKTIKKVKIISE